MFNERKNLYINGNCFVELPKIKEESIDMILVDLPYGITQNEWDKKLPLNNFIFYNNKYLSKDEFILHYLKQNKKRNISYYEIEQQFEREKQYGLWHYIEKIIKPNGAIVMFSQGEFTAELINSNKKMWHYNLIWQKTHPTGFYNANKMPLRIHEDICVFYKKLPTYNPQKTYGHKPVNTFTKHSSNGTNYGKSKLEITGGGNTDRYPTSVILCSSDTQKIKIHPTEKPVKLLEWLIKTYTNEGEIVLDFCAGSFSTGIACLRTNRNFVGIELNPEYYAKGLDWINNEISNM